MRATLSFLLFFLVLANFYSAQSQNTKSVNYTVVVLGKDNQPLYGAKITFGDKEFSTDGSGELKFDNPGYTYIKVSAAGYLTKKVNLSLASEDKRVTVFLSYLGDQTTPLVVYVKDRNNKPISGAVVLVIPGMSGVTNASGKAITEHKQQPGEYIQVRVEAKGYKDQQQQVIVGTGKTNAFRRAPDVANFILDKGGNDKTVFNINVEVLDKETDKPVAGAKIKLKLSDGNEMDAVSNAKGEAMIRDGESYEGVTIRVMATHPDYKESWSDIPQELLKAENSDTRLFTVFMEPKASSATWAGTWKNTDNNGTFMLSGSGSAVSGTTDYAVSDWKSHNDVSGCKVTGTNKITCQWNGKYEDSDKTVTSGGTVELTLSGDQMNGVWKEVGAGKITWKPGRSQYSVTLWSDGQIWRNAYIRK